MSTMQTKQSVPSPLDPTENENPKNCDLPQYEQGDMMWSWKREISTRSGPNRRLWNTHVHDANEAISTKSAGSDGRRKTACPRVQTSATAHFTRNYEITSSE